MNRIPENGANVGETVKPISLGGWKVHDIRHAPLLIWACLLSIGLLCAFFMEPAYHVFRARNWVQTPCVIQQIWVRGKVEAYTVEVRFSYHGPHGHKITRQGYNFGQQSSKTMGPKRKIVKSLPPGSHDFCFVNPDNPREAIFRKNADLEFWVAGIMMLVGPFGLVVFLWAFVWRRKSKMLSDYSKDVMQGLWPVPPEKAGHGPEGPLHAHGSDRSIVGVLIVFLVIVGVWVVVDSTEVFGESSKNTLVILGLVAAPIVVTLAYYLLKLRNPLPIIVLPNPIRQGKPFSIQWDFQKREALPEHFSIHLNGREKVWWGPVARYGYSKQNAIRTKTASFFQLPVYDSKVADISSVTSQEVIIPTDTMHSLGGHRNVIEWELVLESKAGRLPTLVSAYALTVLPCAFIAGERHEQNVHGIGR